MLIFENLKLALSSIRVNKMRSFLTMLGMIIGISSVIAIVSIGDTMRNAIAKEYENIGSGIACVYIVSESGYYGDNETFTLDELEKMEETFKNYIDYHITPTSSDRVDIVNGRNTTKVSISGIREGYEDVAKTVKLVKGRMINENDVLGKKMNIVLEESVAKELFGNNEPLGRKINVITQGLDGEERKEMNVVGIYRSEQSAIMKLLGGNSIKEVYVPQTALTGPDDRFFDIYLYRKNSVDDEFFRERVLNYISRIKNTSVDNIIYYSAEEESSSIDSMMNALSIGVGAIASISLIVGGIGIMNIMLVSVTERTREIGIRKALGARRFDILMQFLIESAIISALGGVIGTLLGCGVVMVGGNLVGIEVVIKPYVVVGAVLFSAVVGIFFGMYPSSKASKKDPIESLRYE